MIQYKKRGITMRKHLFEKQDKKEGRSFYTVLFLSFFIASVIPTLLLTIFLTVNFFNSVSSSSKSLNKQLLAQTNYAINQMHENVNWLTSSLLNDDHISNYLSLTSLNNDAVITVLADYEIQKQLASLPYIDSIYLYNAELNVIYSSKSRISEPLESFFDPEVSSYLLNETFSEHSQDKPVLSENFFTYYMFDTQDAIIINVKTSALTDSIVSMKNFTNDSESNFLLLDSDMNYLISVLDNNHAKDKTWMDAALKSLSQRHNSNSSLLKLNGHRYFQTNTNKNIYHWNLFNLTPANIIFQNMIATILFVFFILVGILILTLFICNRFAKKLNEPIVKLSQHLTRTPSNIVSSSTFQTKEFQKILSTISSLKKNNEKLHSVQEKSRYSLTQSCLNSFVSNRQSAPASFDFQKLEHLNISYLVKDKLCMAVFKIDNYPTVLDTHTSDELWAIQFAVVNIIEELISTKYKCNAFSRNDDKFVLLISCASANDLVTFENNLIMLFQEIQKNIDMHLHFTMTVAYSTIFHGLDKIPSVYSNTRHSLSLKMRYGHNSIIDPYMIDEIQVEPFQFSAKDTAQLIECLANGQFEQACVSYKKMTENLFFCDYDEIISTMIHLIHSIYDQLLGKYPMLKDTFNNALKPFVSKLNYAETSEDIQNLSHAFLKTLCSAIQKLKEDPTKQNSAIVTEKISQIIEEQYSDFSLCLASIAEEVGLSPNYTGQIFKQYTKKSVSQYLLEVRMEKIASYLQTTSLPLSQILDQVGMEMNNYFYTRFKNYFGISLSEYRQKFQNTEKNES